MNNRKWLPFAVVGGIVVMLIVFSVSKYNTLVGKSESVDSSWAQVQNVLQRRADLIPNLVSTVKGYAAHEKEIFENVANARAKLAGAKTPTEASAANGQLDSALSRLLVIAENYPQLKANESFVRLQDELAGTENRIAVERKRYNDDVRDFNATIKRFPSNMVAGLFSFHNKDYFQADAKAQQVPDVKF
ncbi:MAG: LemA family protein [Kofleriaceae bacterium]